MAAVDQERGVLQSLRRLTNSGMCHMRCDSCQQALLPNVELLLGWQLWSSRCTGCYRWSIMLACKIQSHNSLAQQILRLVNAGSVTDQS
jgi:hypothetical protein